VSFPNPRKNPQQQIDCTRYRPDPDFKNGEMFRRESVLALQRFLTEEEGWLLWNLLANRLACPPHAFLLFDFEVS
jgi:hypothetical protein